MIFKKKHYISKIDQLNVFIRTRGLCTQDIYQVFFSALTPNLQRAITKQMLNSASSDALSWNEDKIIANYPSTTLPEFAAAETIRDNCEQQLRSLFYIPIHTISDFVHLLTTNLDPEISPLIFFYALNSVDQKAIKDQMSLHSGDIPTSVDNKWLNHEIRINSPLFQAAIQVLNGQSVQQLQLPQ